MAVRKIIRMGHPTLRKVARPLSDSEILSGEIARLVHDMTDTLHDYGGIGLAAPQVDESVRLAMIEIPSEGSRYGDLESLELTVFINPVVSALESSRAGYWEGCLSIPGLRGWVERPQRVRVDYKDLELNEHSREFEGFHATVVQHEFDHLDGFLYVDRLTDMTRLMFESEFERLAKEQESVD
ncbi:MAG: peptide deformylase [Gammaproteobacteria bacterium]|nr:peptide deformylase [Gammaproteobacteria bacterium]